MELQEISCTFFYSLCKLQTSTCHQLHTWQSLLFFWKHRLWWLRLLKEQRCAHVRTWCKLHISMCAKYLWSSSERDSWITCALCFQGLITCPCKVPVQAPTSPPTCPVARWICPPAAMARWVVTITPSLPPRACQLRAKWTWPRASPWGTMGLGQTWTCSPIKVTRVVYQFPLGLAAHH